MIVDYFVLTMTIKNRKYCDVWRGLVWSAFFHALFLLIIPGVGALKFLQNPPQLQASRVGWSVDYNCTTDDPSATVSLLQSNDFGFSYNVIPVSPNKLLLRKQVFTVVNLILSDGGFYKCKATDQSGQTIEWNSGSMLFVQAAQLPRHFVLKPNKPFYVLQGQSGEVTCEAEGPSVSTLKWEKKQDDKSYTAVPKSQVNITKDANYVRATLKITNAKFADTGTYKCTVSVPPNLSDYKLTAIKVKGALKFLQDPPQLQVSHVGWSVDYNCTTDDPYATVSLLHSRDFGLSYNVLQVSPNKLLLRKQVFTIVNLILSDGGNYKCKATDQSGQTIEWNSGSMLFIQAAQLPRHFVLKPNKPIHVLQGQSGEVTCEAEGPSVSTLKWEKQQDDKSYAAVPKSQVNVAKDTKYVRATLKITNAQFADTGTYKCTVSVPPNKSDYKLTAIKVKGALKFLQDPPQLQASHVGWSVDYNCTTDDPYATVSLLRSKDFGVSYNVFPISPNKLLLRKQVFTVVNLVVSDGGYYKCKATDRSGQTIEWSSGSMLFVQAAQLPRHFVLKPNKPIHVLQGKSGEVTCEAEGPSVSALKWEKQQDDKSYAAVPNSQVNVTKDTKYVRATLKITNAKFADTGTYKCTVSVPPNKSDYKVTAIKVKGALKFLQDPPQLQASHVGWSVDYNCTTDDPYATVSLLHSRDFGLSYNVLQVSPNKLLLRKQVFTIVNLILSDGGNYKCKAMDQSGQTIEWNSGSMLFIQAAQLPRHFVVKPNKPIHVLQGQSGEVTCEAEGPSVSTLKWEKQQDDKSYAAVPKSQVNVTKDTKYVRATLKIRNAQLADTGTYKCTVSVPPNLLDYKMTAIKVKGTHD